jgi:hypothetical protein
MPLLCGHGFLEHPKSIRHLPQSTPLCHRNMKSVGQLILQLQSGIRNLRCPPGGDIEYWIVPEIDRACTPPHPAMPLNHEINRVTRSAVTVRGIWNPRCPPGGHIEYLIMPEIDRAPPQPTPLCHRNMKSGDPFCSYMHSPEYEIQDVCLAAILNIGECPKSIGHLPQPTLLGHRNMKSIGQPVLQLQFGIRNPRCPSGGHIEYWTAPKINRAPPPIHPAMPVGEMP